jgi:polyketide biosynthesis enoyl-CoA hydratase PksI
MSKVVKLFKEGSIGIVALEEREYKNTFSKPFINDLKNTFEAIGRMADISVVVVHGYDNYFCCGATKEELINILGQELQFTDLDFHDLLLRCEVPVISAMQGHALGGGLVFGCYADIIVMGEECLYSTNFMKYGFTPGMGATYIIPNQFGKLLGTEMLLSAKNYYGRDLKERGAPVKVVKKAEVIKTAMGIAKELADKPLLSLKVLKKHLTRQICSELPDVIARELEMHKITFAQPEVRQRIESLFGN